MPFSRLTLSAFVTLVSIIITPSLASACCEAAAPIAYPSWYGCGNCIWGGWNGWWNAWGGWPAWGGRPAWAGPPSLLGRGIHPAVAAPYQIYSPDTVWAPAADYPYVPGYARPYYGRYAFHDPAYMNPRYEHVPHRWPVY